MACLRNRVKGRALEAGWAREEPWYEAGSRTHHLGLTGPGMEFEVHCTYKGKQGVLNRGVQQEWIYI